MYTRSRSSSVVVSIVPTCATPALLTRTSSGPYRSSTAAKARVTSCCRETSHAKASAVPPAARIDSSVSSAGETSMIPTCAPRAAKSRAIACPIPEPPPVTIAVRPARGSADPSAMHRYLEVVEPRSVLAEEGVPLRVGPVRRELVHDRAPAFGASAQPRDGPIGAVQQPRRAEAGPRLLDVRAQRRGIALVRPRLGEQPGDLAHDAVVQGQHAEPLGPTLERVVADRRL